MTEPVTGTLAFQKTGFHNSHILENRFSELQHSREPVTGTLAFQKTGYQNSSVLENRFPELSHSRKPVSRTLAFLKTCFTTIYNVLELNKKQCCCKFFFLKKIYSHSLKSKFNSSLSNPPPLPFSVFIKAPFKSNMSVS